MRRTSLWAERCRACTPAPGQLVFGIVQGGIDLELRERSAAHIVSLGFDGHAIGGLTVGESRDAMFATDPRRPPQMLPAERPRYFMGIGDPEGVIEAIAAGVDMFDCVLPTRLGRTGSALVAGGRLNLRNAIHADDERPLEEGCTCPACATFSRAYIRHLITQDEIVGLRLLTLHNLHVLFDLVRGAREAIRAGTFSKYRSTRLSAP